MDTIFYNGKIITVSEDLPIAEAVLARNGKIEAVGSSEEILSMKKDGDKTVDLNGKAMLPGFIDSHSHISMAKLFPIFSAPPAGDIDSVEKLVEAAKEYLAAHPVKGKRWFLAEGYDNAAFADKKHPTKEDLDKISTTVPIAIIHVSGHLVVLNSLALKQAEITKDTPNPDGGVIRRDANTGEPNGVLEEKAMTDLLRKVGLKLIPPISQIMDSIVEAQKYYARCGITTAQDGASSGIVIAFFKFMRVCGKLMIDICAYPTVEKTFRPLRGIQSRNQKCKKHFKTAGAKIILDGSPQGKTAWFTKPYFEVPDGCPDTYCGYPYFKDSEKLCDIIKNCLVNGWQLLAHCNGDAAMDQYINMYKKAMEETGIKTDLRPVMVHAQTIREDQLDEMKKIGMLPTFFHDHVYYWGDYHFESVLGPERAVRISPLRSALDRGISFTMHQDTPVVPPNMILTIHNAVNRVTSGGRKLGEEYAVTVNEAIKAVTINGAYQYFDEDIKGSIEKGKLADFVILDKSPLDVPAEELKNIKVAATIKENNIIYGEI